MTCEKCWSDAYKDGYVDQAMEYQRLVVEREDHHCTPREQAGEWWDEARQIDSRVVVEEEGE